MESQHSFVTWFRDSSPYIHAHRNKTFVISFGGEAVLADDFDHHVHDFALLSQVGRAARAFLIARDNTYTQP